MNQVPIESLITATDTTFYNKPLNKIHPFDVGHTVSSWIFYHLANCESYQKFIQLLKLTLGEISMSFLTISISLSLRMKIVYLCIINGPSSYRKYFTKVISMFIITESLLKVSRIIQLKKKLCHCWYDCYFSVRKEYQRNIWSYYSQN